jgi:ABC-2 type transport system ATP-binding protein
MEEAEQLCDRVAILDHGRIVAMDTPAELIRSLGGEERLIFTVERVLSPEFEKAINQIGRLEIQGEKMVVHGNTSQDSLVSDVVSLLAKLSIKFHDLRSEQSTLEDVFLKLTGREMKD